MRRLGGYPGFALRALLWLARPPEPVLVRNGVDLYRISYWSGTNGRAQLVSGLMAAPQTDVPRGVALWMHGTNPDRTNSISKPTLQEGVTLSALFGGGGYLLLAPDLLGLGVSHAVQAYLYNPSTIEVTLDFLTAARQVAADLGKGWRRDLYIAGFSQGGHSTAVIQRELERRTDAPMQVRAGAAVAGAYNLADISVPFAMQGHSPGHSVYLSALALSYATYDGKPLESVLNPSLIPLIRRLIDGDHAKEIEAKMPAQPRALFTSDFLTAFDARQPHWFMDAMRANEACAWTPAAPFRAYYGDADVDVPPADSKAFVAEARSRGGAAELVPVGAYDHNETVFHAAPHIRAWFDQLSDA